jgi:tRNA 5-methylaminomethyl-2-thiouridine biosynthesis bifunctional protein
MPAARLSISALADVQKFAELHQLIISPGVVSLNFSERKASRQSKLAAQGFPEDLATYLAPEAVAEKIGIDIGMGGLYHAAGGVVSPPAYCTALIADSPVHFNAGVAGVSGEEGAWQIKCHDGQYFKASHIIYCGGAATPQLINDSIVPKKRFQITSGQLSYMPQDTALSPLKMAINYSGYLLPCGAGVQIAGAGFDPHQGAEVTKEGHMQNLALMPEKLQSLAASPDSYSGRRALRLAVADRLPVAGEISETKYMLTALGARGLTLAGFLAHSLACRIAGRADFLEQPLAADLLPERLKNL